MAQANAKPKGKDATLIVDEHEAEDKNDDGEASDEKQKDSHRQHDSGASDLEKVTDYAEETELSSTASASAVDLFDQQSKMQEMRNAKEKELAKVLLKKEDVELIMNEMEVSKLVAEKKLREHKGDLRDTLRAMINA